LATFAEPVMTGYSEMEVIGVESNRANARTTALVVLPISNVGCERDAGAAPGLPACGAVDVGAGSVVAEEVAEDVAEGEGGAPGPRKRYPIARMAIATSPSTALVFIQSSIYDSVTRHEYV
jgi:hypothetical protein